MASYPGYPALRGRISRGISRNGANNRGGKAHAANLVRGNDGLTGVPQTRRQAVSPAGGPAASGRGHVMTWLSTHQFTVGYLAVVGLLTVMSALLPL